MTKKFWIIYVLPDTDSTVLVTSNSKRDLTEDCEDFPEGHVYEYDAEGEMLTNEVYLGRAKDL